MNYKISVIVPVYNVENYIKECLDSLFSQTLEELEIIIVNDGSKDNSLTIIEDLIKNKSNVKLINKENEGLGAARNTGLNYATGEYVAFIDSDDFVNINMFKDMYNLAKRESSDIVTCGNIRFYDGDIIKSKTSKEYKVYNSEEALKLFLQKKIIEGFAVDKIYKKSLFIDNNIRYPEGKYYEDMEATVRLLFYANKITTLNSEFYYYRQRAGAITKVYNKKMIDDFNDTVIKVNEFIDEKEKVQAFKEEIDSYNIFACNYSYFLYTKYLKKSFYNLRDNNIFTLYNKLGLLAALSNKCSGNGEKIKFLLLKFKILPLLIRIKEIKNK
ncbi:glycosyltransferase family 2 protein [Clostridium fallax]|uniref:Glycosyltransferase involved in cell wall bisynthesis n=1 Tax=Clostridium fallax TaxID=1533 RepID=A0A1M4SYK0_9CLOT|nr:glycosyltransferase [Clostridium fallax]SHE37265.1 Glycosyltransferase involved in cell wall bisynthesis [Clostridium fallax]SQB08034.1 glycosyl transferase family protein [Clostridium fallax]